MTAFPAVRAARPDDYPQIMQMCALLHEENGAVAVDWPTVEATIMRGINNDMAMIGVIGKVGHIEGMVYLKFSSMWYSVEPMLEELFLYVQPEFRRSANAKALLQFTRATAKKLKLRLIIGVISSKQTEAKLRLYERQLGTPRGGVFFIQE